MAKGYVDHTNNDTKEIFDQLVFQESYDLEDVLKMEKKPSNQVSVVSGVMDVLEIDDEALAIKTSKQLFKERLHKTMPRTIVDWLKGQKPSVKNKRNNFELCYALGLDFEKTQLFFQTYFLCVAFNYKNQLDAIFAYSIKNKKDYAFIEECLDLVNKNKQTRISDTSTIEIEEQVLTINDDEVFKQYVLNHCIDRTQFFHRARNEIKALIDSYDFSSHASLHEALMGFNFQSYEKELKHSDYLPSQVVECLPNDGTFGRILNDQYESYETLRKTFIILAFYDFYIEANTTCFESDEIILQNLLDFYEETDHRLLECGFTPLYVKNPFDWFILYCAKDESPIHKFYELNDLRFIEE